MLSKAGSERSATCSAVTNTDFGDLLVTLIDNCYVQNIASGANKIKLFYRATMSSFYAPLDEIYGR